MISILGNKSISGGGNHVGVLELDRLIPYPVFIILYKLTVWENYI